jgi:hypothetical protein
MHMPSAEWATIAVRMGAALLIVAATSNAIADTSLEGIVTGTYQAADTGHINGQKVRSEADAELYLLGALDWGPGSLNLEVRGSPTPRDDGVTSFYDSNALVGETVAPSGRGRLAATQLYYKLPAGSGNFRTGLLDPTDTLDTNDVDDDEYTQFIADNFVNNPSIGFPSYVLGALYQGQPNQHVDYKLFIGSDSGLQSDEDPTYGNVLDVTGRRNGHHKGAFADAEIGWEVHGYALRAGAWYDTGKVDRLDSRATAHAYGIYLLAGLKLGAGRVQCRAGIANGDAQAAANFLSLAYQLPMHLGGHAATLGVAVARTGASHRLGAGAAPIYQAEAYWRFNIAGSLYVSPDIQYIKHAGFDAGRDGTVIGGFRIGLTF